MTSSAIRSAARSQAPWPRGGTLDIRSLLLIAPAGLGPAVNGGFIGGYLGATSEASLTPWMRELVADPAVITPAFVRATLKAREETALLATQRRIADAVFPDGTQGFGIRTDLAKLRMATRIVVGTADRIIPAAQADGLPAGSPSIASPVSAICRRSNAATNVTAIMTEMSRSTNLILLLLFL